MPQEPLVPERQSRYAWPGNEAKGRKTCGRGVKRTQMLAMGCSTRKPALWQGSPVCRRNGRILLANPILVLNDPIECSRKYRLSGHKIDESIEGKCLTLAKGNGGFFL